MLQRAASNAYSWWYASHVRTKQSKWLEQSLQDMGEKVEDVLKLIQEDGDSFAKRAEMYYKKRPELINFVEESYRAYRSLAERYDHLSRELQNANNTLASAFPDQYQFPMDDDDDYNTPKMQRKFQERPSNNSNIPQAPPKFPSKNIKAIIALTANSNRSNPPKTGPNSGSRVKKLPKSGLTISEAINEIDKLQKQILTLQTEKEFAKSSYESGYAKYWDIDEQIIGTQEKISKLQDEFEVAQVIEDDEARSLMAEAAIKSCNDTLAQLQEKQERAAEEAKAEYQKIREARDKLKSLKAEFLGDQTDASEDQVTLDETASGVTKSEDLELLRDKIKEHFDVSETASLSVLEMAEKIDELVNKVINLQSSMSSQTALIHSLRSETDELQSQVKSLEDDKANLIAGKTTLTDKLGEMENKLKGLQDLNDSLENQNSNLETQFKEAYPDLDNISREPLDAKSNEGEVEHHTEFKESKGSITYMELKNEIVQDEQKGDVITSRPIQEEEGKVGKVALLESKDEAPFISLTDDIQPQESRSSNTDNYQQHEPKPSTNDDYQQQEPKPSTTDNCGKSQPQETSNVKEEEVINPQTTHKQQPATQESIQEAEPRELTIKSKDEPNAPLSMPPPEENQKEEEPDWKQLFTDGLQGKEKVLLAEYTATLRNYKETKKKLCEVEKKNEENFSELEKQLKELKCSLTMRDEELHSLRQKLSVVQRKLDEYRYAKENYVEPSARTEKASPPPEEDDEDIKVIPPHEGHEISPVEQKLRTEMDQILEENLDFWMRFSASFGQVQKFQNVVQDLQTELAKLEKNSDKKEGNIHGDTHVNLSLKSDVRPIYKHLREIDTELTVWLEQSEKLKEELQRRFSQLCHIQEEIKHTLSTHAEDDDMKFTSFQAAKFQGEVANMQQENNKVADELQASMDYITSLQLEVERTTNRLNEELGFSSSRNQNESERSGSRARVPLRSFIFGVKPQKKKQSIFSCMHPGMINRRYHHLKSDKSP